MHSFISQSLLAFALLALSTSCSQTHRSVASSSPSAATQPSADSPRYTYVLVHGAWAGAWEWKRVGELLLADGHIVYRPTLTGQGERVHLANPDIDLETHITDVVNVILFEDLHEIVLMGHSYGGMVITGVADRVPDRIKAVVYVDAFLPNDGESLNSATTRPLQVTNGFVNPLGPPPPANRQPPYVVPHPAKTLSQAISLKNPAGRTIPTVYILTVDPGRQPEQDRFFRSYQRAKDRGWTTWIMEGGHVVNVTAPAELVKLLEKAPTEAKPATASATEIAAAKDLAQLQGEWQMVSGTADGFAMPDAMLSNMKRVCRGDELTVTNGEQLILKAKVTLDTSKTPKAINYDVIDGPTKGQKQLGIYEVSGDTMKSCFGAPGMERPTEFESRSGDRRTATVWKRVKPWRAVQCAFRDSVMPKTLRLILVATLVLHTTALAVDPTTHGPATRPELVTVRVFHHPDNAPYLSESPVISPDGKCVAIGAAIGDQRSEITIYNTDSGRVVYKTDGPAAGDFWLAAFSPDSTKAAFIRPHPPLPDGPDYTIIEVIDLATGGVHRRFDAAPVLTGESVNFTPDGSEIAFPSKRSAEDADDAKSVFLCMNLATGELANTYRFRKGDGLRIFSADGSKLLSRRGEVWDTRAGSRITQLDWPRDYRPIAIRFLPDGKHVRAIERDCSSRTWDAASGKLIRHTEAPAEHARIREAELSEDCERFFVSTGSYILMFDASTGAAIAEWSPPQEWGITQFTVRPGAILLEKGDADSTRMATMPFPPIGEFVAVQPTSARSLSH